MRRFISKAFGPKALRPATSAPGLLRPLSFRSHEQAPHHAPHIPPGQRVYAIGDIHGCVHLLDAMIEMIRRDREGYEGEWKIIFLGDYINRGPSSAQVLDRLCDLRDMSWHYEFLMGNHEDLALQIINGSPRHMKAFIRMGGRETMLSYGMALDQYRAATFAQVQQFLIDAMPTRHRAFLHGLKSQLVVGDYLFVHAGVDVTKPVDAQIPDVTRWIREDFTDAHVRYEKMVVHGHSIAEEAVIFPWRIGIDTGAYATGRLTALALENGQQRILQTGRD